MDNINNIYSFLLLTGYLKVKEDKGNHQYELIIPNRDVYEIYQQSFMDYFDNYTTNRKKELYQLLVEGDAERANELLNDILERSISYYDNYENFYHGFLVGLLSHKKVESNREVGKGRFDLAILPRRITGTALIIECNHSTSVRTLIKDAKERAKQIVNNRYMEKIVNDGYANVIGYGISFYKKQCYVEKVE